MKKLVQLCVLSCFALSSQIMGVEGGVSTQHIECKHKKPRSASEKALKKKENLILAKSAAPSEISYHPLYYVKDIGAKGKSITTYDETVWEISNRGSKITSKWVQDLPIIITLNHSWFSSYEYCLKNPATQELAPANLSLGPFLENAIFISSINHKTISLTNGSKWTTSFWTTLGSLKNWDEGHAVLIGETGNNCPPYYILINVNENNYITVDLKQ